MSTHSSRADVARIPPTNCLECGYRMDAIGTMDGSVPRPKPGDAIACMKCGAVCTVEDDGRHLRGFTDAEMTDLVADNDRMDQLAHLVKGIHFLKHLQN